MNLADLKKPKTTIDDFIADTKAQQTERYGYPTRAFTIRMTDEEFKNLQKAFEKSKYKSKQKFVKAAINKFMEG